MTRRLSLSQYSTQLSRRCQSFSSKLIVVTQNKIQIKSGYCNQEMKNVILKNKTRLGQHLTFTNCWKWVKNKCIMQFCRSKETCTDIKIQINKNKWKPVSVLYHQNTISGLDFHVASSFKVENSPSKSFFILQWHCNSICQATWTSLWSLTPIWMAMGLVLLTQSC